MSDIMIGIAIVRDRATRTVEAVKAVRVFRRRGTTTPPDRPSAAICQAAVCKAQPDDRIVGAGVLVLPGLRHRTLPHGEEQMALCAVPAQDSRSSLLHPTDQVAEARPDLTPVWCHDCGIWLHAAPCYSLHHHPGWTPATDDNDNPREH
jgi:hypothetical protein